MSTSTSVPTKFPDKILEEMNDVVEEGWYTNRSELVRDAVRERLRELKAERLEEAIKQDVRWGLHGD
jgi:Arc/MetJ-type ribon-helix-helix transcriptional regulator